jgi:hypothetical protein
MGVFLEAFADELTKVAIGAPAPKMDMSQQVTKHRRPSPGALVSKELSLPKPKKAPASKPKPSARPKLTLPGWKKSITQTQIRKFRERGGAAKPKTGPGYDQPINPYSDEGKRIAGKPAKKSIVRQIAKQTAEGAAGDQPIDPYTPEARRAVAKAKRTRRRRRKKRLIAKKKRKPEAPYTATVTTEPMKGSKKKPYDQTAVMKQYGREARESQREAWAQLEDRGKKSRKVRKILSPRAEREKVTTAKGRAEGRAARKKLFPKAPAKKLSGAEREKAMKARRDELIAGGMKRGDAIDKTMKESRSGELFRPKAKPATVAARSPLPGELAKDTPTRVAKGVPKDKPKRPSGTPVAQRVGRPRREWFNTDAMHRRAISLYEKRTRALPKRPARRKRPLGQPRPGAKMLGSIDFGAIGAAARPKPATRAERRDRRTRNLPRQYKRLKMKPAPAKESRRQEMTFTESEVPRITPGKGRAPATRPVANKKIQKRLSEIREQLTIAGWPKDKIAEQLAKHEKRMRGGASTTALASL